MKIKFEGTITGSDLGIDKDYIQKIVTEALQAGTCPFPYDIKVETKEVSDEQKV